MTSVERLERLEALLQTLVERLTDPELIQLVNEALKRLAELKEHERLLSEIF